ncbi:GntR family transcriptional regulator [Geodermatophilus telluris]|uniref:GntR family transcriptional regulator n=1 Tax=Geodermatophilus telluris TaxID=1190417 RepID=A0A1G6MLL8_9ACTN|nr:GntR family transcriptional regulator [Geodermatophilus telluris]SDC56443.1 GntR family transcriptional regulator [Geodermatophilus telluris]
MPALDRAAGRPLHVQVADALRAQIRDHRLPPGSALDSEVALQERFGVARSVVRQALSTLVAEGLVERSRGRGSVVAPARQHHRLVQRASGLYTQMAAEGLEVTTAVLSLTEEPASSAQDRWLGGDRVLRLERLRRVDGRPLARIRTALPLPRCAGLTAEELTDASLHEVLTRRLGARPTGGRRQVRAVAADTDLARELETRTGAPLLLLEGQTQDQDGRPLEVFATWHRAEDIAFDVDLEAGPMSPSGPALPPPPPDRDGLRAAAEQAQQLADRLRELADRAG